MNSEGLGLGLMICKNLVEENNGSLQVYSEGLNRGSTFSFTMQMESVGGFNELEILKQQNNQLLNYSDQLDKIFEIGSQNSERQLKQEKLQNGIMEYLRNSARSEASQSLLDNTNPEILLIVNSHFNREALAITLKECFGLTCNKVSEGMFGLQMI